MHRSSAAKFALARLRETTLLICSFKGSQRVIEALISPLPHRQLTDRCHVKDLPVILFRVML
jgi:hypothetical protein